LQSPRYGILRKRRRPRRAQRLRELEAGQPRLVKVRNVYLLPDVLDISVVERM
jgi:hypothetical protein